MHGHRLLAAALASVSSLAAHAAWTRVYVNTGPQRRTDAAGVLVDNAGDMGIGIR